MSEKNRDLVELLKFQRDAMVLCQRVTQTGEHLQASVDEASVCLQDEVSKRSLQLLEDVVQKLTSISAYGQREMETAARKTMAELDAWEKL